jgi:uncharacterized spore protein YtfJ
MTTPDVQARQAAEHDHVSRLLQRLVSQVGGHARVQAVFGDPVARDAVTVIPVARVRWGVGGGGGSGPDGSGSGGGGGVAADPIGYIEITPSGADFRPIGRSFGPAVIVAAAIAAAIIWNVSAEPRTETSSAPSPASVDRGLPP